MSTPSNQPPNWNDQEFKDKVKHFEDTFEKMAKDSGERLGSLASSYKSKASESLRHLGNYIKENPVKSLALGATAGFISGGVISLLMRLRRK